MEKPRAELENLAEETTQQEQTLTHNLYLCNDVSCQRILKTMLLQKFDDLKSHIVEDKSSSTAVAGMASLTVLRASTFFEDYLITIVKYLSQKKWKSVLASATTDQEQHGATATLTKNTNKTDDTTTATDNNTFNSSQISL